MDSEKSKKILIAVAVVCVAVAGYLFFSNMSSDSGNPPGGVGDVAFKCTKCGAAKMINRNTAMEMGQQQGTLGFGPPVLDCQACGAKRTLTAANQCPGCSTIYFPGESKDPQAPMKCPKCGKSPEEFLE